MTKQVHNDTASHSETMQHSVRFQQHNSLKRTIPKSDDSEIAAYQIFGVNFAFCLQGRRVTRCTFIDKCQL